MSGLTEEEKEYLKNNYVDQTYKELAKALNKSVSSVNHAISSLGLKKRREWTPKEEAYLEDCVGRTEIDMIAKQMFRTPGAIRKKLWDMGVKVRDPYVVSLKEVARRIGISSSFLYNAVSKNKLITHGRNPVGAKAYIVSNEDVRQFIVDYHPHKKFKCYKCTKHVYGDMFCERHKKYDMKRTIKKEFVPSHIVRLKKFGYLRKLGEALKEIRNEQRLSQYDVSEKLGYNQTWYGFVERAKRRNFSIEELQMIAEALDCEVSIEIRKKYKNDHVN